MIKMDIQHYYDKRAIEYEEIYHRPDPVRQKNLAELAEAMQEAMTGRRVLEVACGTGYWTEKIAKTAEHIVAIDAAPATLEIARSKKIPEEKVEWKIGDAYKLTSENGLYNAGLAMCWFSHIPRARITEFLSGFHTVLQRDSIMFIGDNTFKKDSGGEFIQKNGSEDTFKIRTLSDGSKHEIIKNYFSEQELKNIFSRFGQDVYVRIGSDFWWVQYTTA